MTVIELGNKLKSMYEMNEQNKVAMIHLFGVIYADQIIKNDIKPKDIIKAAQMRESYATEVSKGIKLSKYVELKNQYKNVF